MRSCLIVKIEIGCEFGSTRGSLFSNGLLYPWVYHSLVVILYALMSI